MTSDTDTGTDRSADLDALRKRVRAFAEEVVAPRAAAMDANARLDDEVLDGMGRLGLFGLPVPREYGGQGGDYRALCTAIEELARVDSATAIALEAGVGLGIMPILRFGTGDQRRRWLPDLAAGTAIGAFGLTELDGGSDWRAMKTTARLDGGEWVLDGAKAYITNAGLERSSVVTVACVTGADDRGRPEITAILVPTGTPGFTVGPRRPKIGWRGAACTDLFFDGARVPAGNQLGERGQGLRAMLGVLDEGRVAIAAMSTGVIQGCVDESVAFATRRQAFGTPIARHQAVAFKIADMEVRAHTARLAWQDAADRLVAGRPFAKEAAIAKLYASEAAVTSAREAVQVWGGAGFMDDTPVARFYRDSKVLEIGEGTSEIMRMLIGRSIGLDAGH
jgi:alkylation response protein AidB-like acyl-CoA dehydrogenase